MTPVSIYAHRGASAHAPENTLAAFAKALEAGADGVELDVKLTRDGKVIVLHDPTLDRTTTGKGSYKNLSFSDLRKLDAGTWYGEAWRGEKLPLLAEVFDLLGGKIGINIELTNYSTPGDGLVDAVAKVLAGVKDTSRVMFSSFRPANLLRARSLLPAIPCGLLALPGLPGWLARNVQSNQPAFTALHPYYRDISPALVQRIHARGKALNTWTINDPQVMTRLRSIGVDMIMTDDPALAIASLH